MQKRKNNVGILDSETDPFIAGRVPEPFTFCVYFTDTDNVTLWEDSAIARGPKRIGELVTRLIRGLKKLGRCTLFAHNGGKFDFHFLIEYANRETITIRNGRISQMQIGMVTLKDSWPLMPFPLREYKKDSQDYTIHEHDKRNQPQNKKTIEAYQLHDCKYLAELLRGFHHIVGEKDTIGSAAFATMRQLGIKIQSLNESHDSLFRDYFFGGRVEALRKGIHRGTFQYLDINSAYPYAMLSPHPHGPDYLYSEKLPRRIRPYSFIRLIAVSRGCFPIRLFNNAGTPLGIDFPRDNITREYLVTGHELIAGIETKTISIKKIIDVWTPVETIDLSPFVKYVFPLKAKAKKDGDAIAYLAYKYLGNSGYGKFAQNPKDFKEYVLADYGDFVDDYEWDSDYGAISLHQKSSYYGHGFYDVATGASITGAVRSILWRAVCAAKNVLYMDTDSILCQSAKVKQGLKLGEWKLEGLVTEAAIAGKKLYAVKWKMPQKDGETEKIASKGARLCYNEILEICRGNTVEWMNAAPTYSLTKGAHFINRKIRRT